MRYFRVAFNSLFAALTAFLVAKYCQISRHELFLMGTCFGASIIMALRDVEKLIMAEINYPELKP